MVDLLIRGATVVDGTGAAPHRGDVAVSEGRIVEVGEVDETATRVVDADGLVLCPGFVDPHTHYDAQLFWDPHATPSSSHGVTTVIGGNCGFTLAPLAARDADYTRRMMAKVEGMPLAALEAGATWDWEGFDGYLDRLDGRIGVNAGFLVGHCALRRAVMGAAANEREATGDELADITGLLHRALDAGALGLSTTRSPTHVDGEGAPVPSRLASVDEVMQLCRAVGEHAGTVLEAIIEGCLGRFTPADEDLLAGMSAAAGRPLNWNILGVDAADPDRPWHQLQASNRAREQGGRVVALTMPILVPMTMSFGSYCALWLIPGWGEVLDVPIDERIRRLRDPAVRTRMLESARASNLSYTRLAEFGSYVIGDTAAPENAALAGRRVDVVAKERGLDPFTCVVEIAAADRLTTMLWPQPTNDGADDWDLRRRLWEEPDILLGGSDAGAHIDRMCGAPYPTRFLADTIRGRRLLPLERAVQLMTDTPARLFGLRDRGRIEPGAHADLVVFDPETVDASPPRMVADLPGGGARLLSTGLGLQHVFVNGTEVMSGGELVEATPGTLLRSGRDTDTVATR
ncbi:MAG: aminoacylase [Actinomycetia bacterium]|nr:aminoacylase [Actinomycetes bacterium]